MIPVNHDTASDKSQAAATLGARGGAKGRGETKRRSPEHYQRLAQIRKENRIKRQKEKERNP